MIYPIYSIKDLKGDFGVPRIEQNEASAKRNFAMMINSDNTMMSFAPSDFELYYIGEFNTATAVITSVGLPEFLVRGSELVGAYNA